MFFRFKYELSWYMKTLFARIPRATQNLRYVELKPKNSGVAHMVISKKRKLLDVFILLVCVGGLLYIFATNNPFHPKGYWFSSGGPGPKNVRVLLFDEQRKHLIAGLGMIEEFFPISYYSFLDKEWTIARGPATCDNPISDLIKVGDALWGLYFQSGECPGGIFISSDGGENWRKGPDIPKDTDPRCLVAVDDSGEELYLGTVFDGVFRSIDAGRSWIASSNGLTSLRIQTMHVVTGKTGHLYVGTLNGLFKTTDSGESWTRLDISVPAENQLIVNIAVDPFQGETVYAIVRVPKGQAYIIVSRDGGTTWQIEMKGLPEGIQPRICSFHPTRIGIVYIGTVFDGVYEFDQAQNMWTPYSIGLPIGKENFIIHDLEWASLQNLIFCAGTDLNGEVWFYEPEER